MLSWKRFESKHSFCLHLSLRVHPVQLQLIWSQNWTPQWKHNQVDLPHVMFTGVNCSLWKSNKFSLLGRMFCHQCTVSKQKRSFFVKIFNVATTPRIGYTMACSTAVCTWTKLCKCTHIMENQFCRIIAQHISYSV